MSTAISPLVLRQHGVPMVSALQGPGEYIVTFPDAFHGGFRSGTEKNKKYYYYYMYYDYYYMYYYYYYYYYYYEYNNYY